MIAIFGRKKVSTERVAHMFAHHIIDVVSEAFPDVAGFINDSPEFTKNPCLQGDDCGKFLLVVIAGNFNYMKQFFNDGNDAELISHALNKLAPAFGMNPKALEEKVKEYADAMSRANAPSKNIIYAMSKGVFWKYNLVGFQDEYFAQMKTPNPIFLKNLDEIMKNFLWDWTSFNEKYKVTPSVA